MFLVVVGEAVKEVVVLVLDGFLVSVLVEGSLVVVVEVVGLGLLFALCGLPPVDEEVFEVDSFLVLPLL